jgi:uncharacterized protein (DUF1501 family)
MAKITRRDFIKQSGFTMVGAGLSGAVFARHLQKASNSALTTAAALSPTTNKLVIIQLAGGNDGLNMVVPMRPSPTGREDLRKRYERLRPTLKVPVRELLSLGRDEAGHELGFHPNFRQGNAGGLYELYRAGRVAVIQGVGYPNSTRSHFHAMDVWHTANPIPDARGWLGKYFDCPECDPECDPLTTIGLAGGLPFTLRGNQSLATPIRNIAAYDFQTDVNFPGDRQNKITTFLTINEEMMSPPQYYDLVATTSINAYNTSRRVQEGIGNYEPDPDIVYDSENNPLAAALEQVAKLMMASPDSRVFYVIIGGWDTHEGQLDPYTGQPPLLMYLSDAVDTFYRDLQRLPSPGGQMLDQETVLMTWSEFGRKVRENGSGGTDHGAASPQLIIGTPVTGGLYGPHPSLTQLDDDEGMVMVYDFRRIYATILERWLGLDDCHDLEQILNGRFESLEFLPA